MSTSDYCLLRTLFMQMGRRQVVRAVFSVLICLAIMFEATACSNGGGTAVDAANTPEGNSPVVQSASDQGQAAGTEGAESQEANSTTREFDELGNPIGPSGLSPDRQMISKYKDEKPYEDGLTMTEFVNSKGFKTLEDMCTYDLELLGKLTGGKDVAFELKKMGYSSAGATCAPGAGGAMCIDGTAQFRTTGQLAAKGYSIAALTFEAYGNGNILISISSRADDLSKNEQYIVEERQVDALPTAEQANQLLESEGVFDTW